MCFHNQACGLIWPYMNNFNMWINLTRVRPHLKKKKKKEQKKPKFFHRFGCNLGSEPTRAVYKFLHALCQYKMKVSRRFHTRFFSEIKNWNFDKFWKSEFVKFDISWGLAGMLYCWPPLLSGWGRRWPPAQQPCQVSSRSCYNFPVKRRKIVGGVRAMAVSALTTHLSVFPR